MEIWRYADFYYLLDTGIWVRQITDLDEAKDLIATKIESVCQFGEIYYEAEYGVSLYEFECKMELSDHTALYALGNLDPADRSAFPAIDRLFGSCPRKRNKWTFPVPYGITYEGLRSNARY